MLAEGVPVYRFLRIRYLYILACNDFIFISRPFYPRHLPAFVESRLQRFLGTATARYACCAIGMA
jgi:hypothetical protein